MQKILDVNNIDKDSLFFLDKKNGISNIPNFIIINLGLELSKSLIKYNKNDRKYKIEFEVKQIINKIESQNIFLRNIELLFNPHYKLNIIKFFKNLARNKKLVVIWPGKILENELIYSEADYYDFAKYNINNYDITILR